MDLKSGVCGLKTSFGPIGPKRQNNRQSVSNSKTIFPILTNRASFYLESRDESNEFLKF